MSKNFIPPTLEEIEKAIVEKGYNVDAEAFFYHYAANNWFRGKTKMVYWKMALAGWSHRNEKTTETIKKTKLFPIPGRCCGESRCPLPAVLKSNTGGYDHYTCGPHLPEEVKKLYTW